MKRACVIVLAVLLSLLGLAALPAAAASGQETTLYEDDQVAVSYRYLAPNDAQYTAAAGQFGSLDGRYLAQVRITNVSAAAIEGWTLMFELADQVTKVAPANLVQQAEGLVVIQSDPRTNKTIKPGKDVVFVFQAKAAGDPQTPTWVTFGRGALLPTTDSDGDALPDLIEQHAGLDAAKKDTDGDGLSDLVEYGLPSDGTKKDTDGDGVADPQEDADSDGLVNLDEVTAGTGLTNPDTDADGLEDGDERSRRTDPLKADTDGDGVEDGEEVVIGSDPLVKEAAFDVTRTLTGGATTPSASIESLTADQVTSFSVSEVPGEQLPSSIPGYVDHGYEFSVKGTFSTAEIAFGFTPEPGFAPAIYTYDESSQRLVKVPNQRVDGDRVVATTTHFSKYILLNSLKFDDVWSYVFLEAPDAEHAYDSLDVVFAIDSSGSMSSNDPGYERIQVAKDFVNRLGDDDRGAVVDFDSRAVLRSGLTSDKAALSAALDGIDASGGTSLTAGVSTALNELTSSPTPGGSKVLRVIILLTDGVGDYNSALTTQAKNAGIAIYTVALGSDVDTALLQQIAAGSGGTYYNAADAGQLSAVFDSINDASDLLKDTDGDGINDYYEKEMSAGHLRLGTGAPVGTMDFLDFQDADSDGDSLKDGDELSIRTLQVGDSKLVWAYLTSDPLKKDSDGDSLLDPVDPHPLTFQQSELLIHQSANREGRRKDPDPVDVPRLVADDLTFNDYGYGDLVKLGPVFTVAKITPESWMWGEFNDILSVGKTGASADAKAAVDGLRDEFRNGHPQGSSEVNVDQDFDSSRYTRYGSGGALSRAVAASPQMKQYTDKAKDLIVQSIVSNHGDIRNLKVGDNLTKNYLYQLFQKTQLRYPVYDFSATDGTQRALSIAIHQFHGHQIRLKNYAVKGNTFSGTLVFHSYDHFGLDPDDEIQHYGFVDWFTLQHYQRFDGKYVPPIAVADVEIPISGSF